MSLSPSILSVSFRTGQGRTRAHRAPVPRGAREGLPMWCSRTCARAARSPPHALRSVPHERALGAARSLRFQPLAGAHRSSSRVSAPLHRPLPLCVARGLRSFRSSLLHCHRQPIAALVAPPRTRPDCRQLRRVASRFVSFAEVPRRVSSFLFSPLLCET